MCGPLDLQLTKPFQVRLLGKGRKARTCPLWPQTAQLLRALCTERQLDLRSEARVFLNHRGPPLTRFGVRFILAKHLRRAASTCPVLRGNASTRTACGTAPPSTCSNPASTCPRSPTGSGMPASIPPIATPPSISR